MAFDPYRKWLGIPVRDQPPNHYRLLNIEALETDPDVISNAADARMAHIKQYQSGKHSDVSQRILNELASAKVCLLNPEKKAAYDEKLREKLREKLKPKKKPTPPPKHVLAPPSVHDEASDVPGGPEIPSFESPSMIAHVSRRSERRQKPQPAIIVVGITGAALMLVILGLFFLTRGDKGREVAAPPAPRRPEPAPIEPAGPADTGGAPATTDAGDTSDGGATDSGGSATDPEKPGEKPGEKPEEGQEEGPEERPAIDDSQQPGPDAPQPSFEDLMGTGGREDAGGTGPDTPGDGGSLAADRLAVPDGAAQQKIKREIHDIFKDEFAAARNSQQKILLARKLFDQAAASADEPDTRFVLLRSACDLAAEAGDVLGAMQVVDTMQQDYNIKPLTVRVYVLKQATESMPSGSRGRMAAQQIVMAAMALADEHTSRDEYDTASGFAALALNAARKSKDASLIEPVTARHRDINRDKLRFASIKEARAALAANPDDPAANLTAGRWYCFARGEWEKGLSLLAKGSDVELAEVAEKEMAGPADPSSQMAVGDAWWEQAEKAEDEIKSAVQARVKHWYQRALPGLEGLAKVKVQKRLETLAAAAAASAPAGGERPKGPKVRGVVQRGNVALASNGTVVTGVSSGAHQLLDGNTTRYTISSGYAYSRWPCEWTITFDKVYNLNAIAIKLWDGDSRYYRYAVAISADGRNYTPLVNNNRGEWRSWQRIRVPSQPVKSVKLFGLYNSSNSQFHVVEFEAYCVIP